MKWTEKQIHSLIKGLFLSWKRQKLVSFKVPEEKAFKRATELIQTEFNQERELEKEVNKIMDDLDQKNPGAFERYKMFPLLKKRLAKEKGFVL